MTTSVRDEHGRFVHHEPALSPGALAVLGLQQAPRAVAELEDQFALSFRKLATGADITAQVGVPHGEAWDVLVSAAAFKSGAGTVTVYHLPAFGFQRDELVPAGGSPIALSAAILYYYENEFPLKQEDVTAAKWSIYNPAQRVTLRHGDKWGWVMTGVPFPVDCNFYLLARRRRL